MRYDTNQVHAAILLIALLPLARPIAARAAAEARPNVLIIHTNGHNFRTLGCDREHLRKEQAFVWGERVAGLGPALLAAPARGLIFQAVAWEV